MTRVKGLARRSNPISTTVAAAAVLSAVPCALFVGGMKRPTDSQTPSNVSESADPADPDKVEEEAPLNLDVSDRIGGSLAECVCCFVSFISYMRVRVYR